METQKITLPEFIDLNSIDRSLLLDMKAELTWQDMFCKAIINIETEKAAVVCDAPVDMLHDDLSKVEVVTMSLSDFVQMTAMNIGPDYDRERFVRSTRKESLLRKLIDHNVYSFVVKTAGGHNLTVEKHTFAVIDRARTYLMWNNNEITPNLEFDMLTGGRNREGFMRILREMVENCNSTEEYSLLYFDIMSFHSINELHGHAMGNAILRHFYTNLVYSDLKPLAYARAESDHFYCVVRRESIDAGVIESLCHGEYSGNGKTVPYHCVCGVYHITDLSESPARLCTRASLASNYVEDEYVHPWRIFDEALRRQFVADTELVEHLDEAIQNNEIQPYFQPIVCLRTGRIAMAEALVRWNSSDYGFISPAIFIPLLENHGIISRVDTMMVDRVFNMIRSRIDSGKTIVPIDVNVSWKDFGDPKFTEHLVERLNDKEVTPDMCRYEITESSIVEMAVNGSQILKMLQENKAQLLIDDFGKGYSFSTMRSVDFVIAKIDKSLIDKLGQDRKTDMLVDTFIGMFHKMGAKVVAEGVEKKEQADYLKTIGCDYIQGFYFYRPMPEKDFLELIDSQQTQAEYEAEQTEPESVWIEREVLEAQNASLQESADKLNCLRMLLAAEGIYYFEWDVRTHVDTCDDSFKRLYNLSSNIIPEMPEVNELCHPDDRDRFSELYYRAERGERMGADYFRILSPDGTYYSWYRKTFYTLFDKDNKPFKVVLTMQDCTDSYKHVADSKRNDLLVSQQGVITFNYTVASDRLEITYLDETGSLQTLDFHNYTSKQNCPEAMDRDILAERISWLLHNDERTGYFDYDDTRFRQTLRVHYSKVDGEYGTLYAIVGQAENILRTREKLNETIATQKEFIAMLGGLSKIYTGASTISLVDGTSHIFLIDKVYEGILSKEMSWDEINNEYVRKFIKPTYREPFLQFMDVRTLEQRLKGNRYISIEYEDGVVGWVRGHILPSQFDDQGRITDVLFFSIPIGSEKSTIDRLVHLSEYDGLTGIRNRYSGELQIEKAIKEKQEGLFAVIDCDRFKEVNDTFGHMIGDHLLVKVAECLKNANPDGITMRLGGDEFALFIKGRFADYEIQSFFDHLFNDLIWAKVDGLYGFPISVSVGAVRYDGFTETSFDRLYHKADSLLYMSKKTPGCKLSF